MADPGWTWFDEPPKEARQGDAETARLFAKCFAGRDGERALAHLRGLTLERHLGPEASDAQLRHLEGQRHLVSSLLALVARGKGGE